MFAGDLAYGIAFGGTALEVGAEVVGGITLGPFALLAGAGFVATSIIAGGLSAKTLTNTAYNDAVEGTNELESWYQGLRR